MMYDGHSSSIDMAKMLATYLDCPQRIRSEVLTTFDRAPDLCAIAGFRADYLAKRNRPSEIVQFKPHEGYYPSDASRRAENDNRRFVAALQREARG